MNVCHCYWDKKPLGALKELWASGSKMRPYFLGTLEGNGSVSKDLLEYKPLWYIHHGNVTDALFRAGKQEQVHDFLKKVHDVLGIPAGIPLPTTRTVSSTRRTRAGKPICIRPVCTM